jgi:Beta-galactosidase
MRTALPLLTLLLPGVLVLDAAAAPPLRPWQEYRTIMWVGDSPGQQPGKFPLFCQRLHDMGVNTAMVYGDADPAPLLQNHFPYYVENLVNRGLCLKWNSHVRDWEKFLADWNKGGRSKSDLVRDYCLDDPQWRAWAREQVQAITTRNRPHQPLAYNLRDELSTTYSANPFDYDFNPIALAGFRRWLKTQYPTLAALNAEWETGFAQWDDVMPFTTDEIKNRMASGQALPRGNPGWQELEALKFDPVGAQSAPTRWNFSPWADFRTYMDYSLAEALDDLRQTAHRIDPQTPVGIEGTQMPNAFGGYDLWRLSRALDWVEPYDIGNAREILGSFMPGLPILTTVFESDTEHARRRLWHLLLEGDRGCIVWWSEDCLDFHSADYALTAKAKALAPALREMTSPVAQLFLRAEPERDPIFIYYSQPSLQVDWLLESTVDGATWPRRFSSFEAAHNHAAQARDGWLKAMEDLGYSPQFISAEQIEAGELAARSNAVVVLSSVYAISDQEAQQLSQVAGRHRLFFDAFPGTFDQHGKLRRTFPTYLFDGGGGFTGDPALYAAERLRPIPSPAALDLAGWLAANLQAQRPVISLPRAARVRVHRFRLPNGSLLAFERNIEYAMSESLQQAGGNEALEKPVEVQVTLPQAVHIYDLNTQTYLGRADHIEFTLDPWRPSLFALTAKEFPAASILSTLAQ